jgi:hypothetical protein
MRSKWIAVVLFTLMAISSGWWMSRGRTADAETSTQPGAQRSVELTVYAQDFGLVREVRPLQLAAGSSRVRLLDVSKELDPHSVLLRCQGDAASLPHLVSHSYNLGVENGEGLLKRYLGKQVELVRYGQNGHEADRQRGTLMVEANGQVVLQTDGKFYIHPDGTVVASADGDVVTIPQLSVQVESPAAQAANLELAYLTRGLSWSADYVATLPSRSSALALECWATVTNRTGVDYPRARVSLIAGTPNRAATPPSTPPSYLQEYDAVAYRGRTLASESGVFVAGKLESPRPEAIGDFHAYRIKNPTTVVQEEMNRLLMLSSAKVPVTRDYSALLPSLSSVDNYWGAPSQLRRGSVQVALTFFNAAKSGLGVPLPQGAIRLYEPDRSGSLRYAGAATIENTPKDQKVQVTLARAFDLFTESRIVKKQRLNKRTVRKQVEVVLHNEKPNAAALRVVQGFGGRWKMVSESRSHVNLDADHAQWRVTIPASGKVTLGYTADLSG